MSEVSAMGCRRLVDKVIVVAGASTGIGRATALRLAAGPGPDPETALKAGGVGAAPGVAETR